MNTLQVIKAGSARGVWGGGGTVTMGPIKNVQTCPTAETAQQSCLAGRGKVKNRVAHRWKSARVSRKLDGWLTGMLSMPIRLVGWLKQ